MGFFGAKIPVSEGLWGPPVAYFRVETPNFCGRGVSAPETGSSHLNELLGQRPGASYVGGAWASAWILSKARNINWNDA